MATPGPRIIVALDHPRPAAALACCEALDPALCRVKIGKELFTRGGPAIVARVQARGFDVFLDLKFHDIPNTVAGACRAAAELGCWMINVHASGGRAMLESAHGAVAGASHRPLLIAVTVLTSLDEGALRECGIESTPAEQAMRLAGLAAGCALDGVVCSAEEAASLRARFGPDFLLVTPGIRPAGAQADDQRRVSTPAGGVAAGADFLVIGRPITQAADPGRALRAIVDELTRAPMR
jgi:orotidine-5'-phosphate decarboxylase